MVIAILILEYAILFHPHSVGVFFMKVLANSTKMCYTYDNLSRVTARTVKKLSDNSVVSTETFNYDAAGNVTDAPDLYFEYDMFIITLVAANTISTSWIRLWILEIFAQLVIFAIAMISSYLKDIYLWSKERKKDKAL